MVGRAVIPLQLSCFFGQLLELFFESIVNTYFHSYMCSHFEVKEGMSKAVSSTNHNNSICRWEKTMNNVWQGEQEARPRVIVEKQSTTRHDS